MKEPTIVTETIAKYTQMLLDIPVRKFEEPRTFDVSTIPLPCIGSGTSRLVFDIGDGFVLKVADTLYGANCNFNEHLLNTLFPKLRSYLCQTDWINEFDLADPTKSRLLLMRNAYQYEPPEVADEDYLDDESLFWLLGELGLDTKELELGNNSIGMVFVDYGATPDGSAIDPKLLIEYLTTKLDKNVKEL